MMATRAGSWEDLSFEQRELVYNKITRKFSIKPTPTNCILWRGGCTGGEGSKTPRIGYRFGEVYYYFNVYKFLLSYALQRNLLDKHQPNHTCDNVYGPCVNSLHIYEGTQSQNMKDRYNRGRYMPTGSRNPHAFLDEEKVLEIDQLLQKGVTPTEVAKHFGVTRETVYLIRKRKIWKHVTRVV